MVLDQGCAVPRLRGLALMQVLPCLRDHSAIEVIEGIKEIFPLSLVSWK